MTSIKTYTAKASTSAGSAPVVCMSRQHLCLMASGICADLNLSRQKDIDANVPESQDDEIPLFEDEDSAAWASFSSNVAIARKSLSSVQVRTF